MQCHSLPHPSRISCVISRSPSSWTSINSQRLTNLITTKQVLVNFKQKYAGWISVKLMKHWKRLPTDPSMFLSLKVFRTGESTAAPYVREVNGQDDNFVCFLTSTLLVYNNQLISVSEHISCSDWKAAGLSCRILLGYSGFSRIQTDHASYRPSCSLARHQ